MSNEVTRSVSLSRVLARGMKKNVKFLIAAFKNPYLVSVLRPAVCDAQNHICINMNTAAIIFHIFQLYTQFLKIKVLLLFTS